MNGVASFSAAFSNAAYAIKQNLTQPFRAPPGANSRHIASILSQIGADQRLSVASVAVPIGRDKVVALSDKGSHHDKAKYKRGR